MTRGDWAKAMEAIAANKNIKIVFLINSNKNTVFSMNKNRIRKINLMVLTNLTS
jgi:hypothetical protein